MAAVTATTRGGGEAQVPTGASAPLLDRDRPAPPGRTIVLAGLGISSGARALRERS